MIDLAYIKVIFYKNKISKIKFVGENKVQIFFSMIDSGNFFLGEGGAIWVEIFFDDGVGNFFLATSWGNVF